MNRLLFLAVSVRLLAGSCQTVDGPAIQAGDFARQIPAFSALPPESEIAAAPLAGVQRIVSGAEILRIARQLHLTLEGSAAPACFELATEPLTEAQLLSALKEAVPVQLQGAGGSSGNWRIDILEFSKGPVPYGKLQFTRGGLEPTGLWHGRLLYGANRSLGVWAKVRVLEDRTWVEASEFLPAGRIIRADQVVLQTGLRSPLDPAPAESLESVVGKKPLRVVAPGTAIRTQYLIEPPQVERGDRVEVQVSKGGAVIEFEAEAASPGHVGDLVFLLNPENGHRFQARVEGKGKVALRK